MTKLIVGCRSFWNAPNEHVCYRVKKMKGNVRNCKPYTM